MGNIISFPSEYEKITWTLLASRRAGRSCPCCIAKCWRKRSVKLGVQLAASATSSLSLRSCTAVCVCRMPYLGNWMGETTGCFPQLFPVTDDCEARAAWRGRRRDKPSFPKLVGKDETGLQWSSSQVITVLSWRKTVTFSPWNPALLPGGFQNGRQKALIYSTVVHFCIYFLKVWSLMETMAGCVASEEKSLT